MEDVYLINLLAQAYSCDAYGAGNYGECSEAASTSTTDGSNTYRSGYGGSSSTSDESTTTREGEGSTQGSDSSGGSSGTTGYSTPSTTSSTMSQIDIPGYGFILIISFVIAFIIAIIALLWRRHRRKDGYDQFDDNDRIYPPSSGGGNTPNQQPPANPFQQ